MTAGRTSSPAGGFGVPRVCSRLPSLLSPMQVSIRGTVCPLLHCSRTARVSRGFPKTNMSDLTDHLLAQCWLLGIAGGIQNAFHAIIRHEPLGQHRTVTAGHHQICDEQIEWLLLHGDAKGFFRPTDTHNGVASPRQRPHSR